MTDYPTQEQLIRQRIDFCETRAKFHIEEAQRYHDKLVGLLGELTTLATMPNPRLAGRPALTLIEGGQYEPGSTRTAPNA